MKFFLSTIITINFVSAAYAQNSITSNIEEVIVTSIKRSSDIVQVPISVLSISSETIKKYSISNLEDLREHTTNLQMSETGISTQVRIRGVGSGNNQGFEQSVGQYVDGIHYGRAQLFRVPYYDLKSVEVLKGPQNTLFGKSTIAGAINIETASPERFFNSNLSVAYFAETNETDFSGFLTGEITPDLLVRGSFKISQSDGFLQNSTKNTNSPKVDDHSSRLKLKWFSSDATVIDLKIEHSTFDREGRQIEIIRDDPSPVGLDLILGQPGNINLENTPSTFNNILSALGQPAFESNRDFVRQSSLDEESKNSVSNISIRSNTLLNELELVNNFSYVNYKSDEFCDCEYVPADIFTLTLDEDYNQISFDSYLKNHDGSNVEYLFGIYLEKYKHEFNDVFSASNDGVFGILGSPLAGTGATRNFNQDSKTFSLYGQFEFPIFDSTSLLFEARYSYEKKEADKFMSLFLENGEVAGDAAACAYLIGLNTDSIQSEGLPNDCSSEVPDLNLGVSPGHDLSDSRSESVFTPAVTIVNNPTDNSSLYASLKRGYKSGGFDVRSNNPQSFEFENENSIAFEIGYKWKTTKSTNSLSIFHTNFKDLQVSQFDGSVGFNVGNAKETVVNGFEFEGSYDVTSNIDLTYGVGYINSEYKDFENGNCAQGEIANGTDTNNDGISDLCDYTGRDLGFAPPLTTNLGIQFDKTIFYDIDTSSSLSVQYIDDVNVHTNMDIDGIQDAYALLNANVSFYRGNWSLSIVGLNLTDEHVVSFAANAPLSGSTFGTETFYGFVKEGRRIGIQLTWGI